MNAAENAPVDGEGRRMTDQPELYAPLAGKAEQFTAEIDRIMQPHAPLIRSIDPADLMALSDDELHARRLGLIAQEARLREQQVALAGQYRDHGQKVRLADAHTRTVGDLHQAKFEFRRRRGALVDHAAAAIVDAACRWSSAVVDVVRHDETCDGGCPICNSLGRRVQIAETDLLAAVSAKDAAATDDIEDAS